MMCFGWVATLISHINEPEGKREGVKIRKGRVENSNDVQPNYQLVNYSTEAAKSKKLSHFAGRASRTAFLLDPCPSTNYHLWLKLPRSNSEAQLNGSKWRWADVDQSRSSRNQQQKQQQAMSHSAGRAATAALVLYVVSEWFDVVRMCDLELCFGADILSRNHQPGNITLLLLLVLLFYQRVAHKSLQLKFLLQNWRSLLSSPKNQNGGLFAVFTPPTMGVLSQLHATDVGASLIHHLFADSRHVLAGPGFELYKLHKGGMFATTVMSQLHATDVGDSLL